MGSPRCPSWPPGTPCPPHRPPRTPKQVSWPYGIPKSTALKIIIKCRCWSCWTSYPSPLTPWDPVGLPLAPWGPVGLTLVSLGPYRPTPWAPGALQAHPLTTWDPVGLPLDPLGPWVIFKTFCFCDCLMLIQFSYSLLDSLWDKKWIYDEFSVFVCHDIVSQLFC